VLTSLLRTALAVAARPGLWVTAVRQWNRLRPADWWRTAPFLPLPDRKYMEFRLQTQYGSTSLRPEPKDVVGYLQWCRDWDRT
jgi:hypothetical protein